MLNPFPELLSFSLIAPFLIRIFLGGYYLLASARWFKKLYMGKSPERGEGQALRLRSGQAEADILAPPPKKYGAKNHAITWLLALGSLSVLAGVWTQIGALVLGFISLYFLYTKREEGWWYGALCIMSLSLLLTGAGFFAFDMPL